MSQHPPASAPRESALPSSLGEIFALEAGEGRTALYLHGVGDAGGLIPSIAAFAARRRVVRPDHPGFLRSPEGGFGSVRELAEWYGEQLEPWGLGERIDLIGCSLGGWIAAELALARPEAFATLTLIDPAGLPGGPGQPDVFAIGAEESIDRTFATAALRSAARQSPPTPELAAMLARSRGAARRIASSPPMHDPALRERLGALRCPTTVIWGEHDGIIPPSTAAAWQRAVPHAKLSVILDAGHLPHLEQPEAFRLAVPHLEA
jgi:pimeloyl-ACP methyl ester carboxylesterase